MPASAVTKSIPSVAVSDDGGASPAVINKPAKASTTSAQKFEKVYGVLNVAGLAFLVPLLRIARGENAGAQLKQFWKLAGVPVVAMLVFMLAWSQMSSRIVTSLGQIPGPSAVWHQVGTLWADHNAERAKREAFYERQAKRNADKLAADPQAEITKIKYTGKPTLLIRFLPV